MPLVHLNSYKNKSNENNVQNNNHFGGSNAAMVLFFQAIRIVIGHILHVIIGKKIFSVRFVDDWENGPSQASRTSEENDEIIFNIVNQMEVENAKVTSQKGEKYLHEPIMNG